MMIGCDKDRQSIQHGQSKHEPFARLPNGTQTQDHEGMDAFQCMRWIRARNGRSFWTAPDDQSEQSLLLRIWQHSPSDQVAEQSLHFEDMVYIVSLTKSKSHVLDHMSWPWVSVFVLGGTDLHANCFIEYIMISEDPFLEEPPCPIYVLCPCFHFQGVLSWKLMSDHAEILRRRPCDLALDNFLRCAMDDGIVHNCWNLGLVALGWVRVQHNLPIGYCKCLVARGVQSAVYCSGARALFTASAGLTLSRWTTVHGQAFHTPAPKACTCLA